ncbi:MAG: ribonuclease P protein component [Chitinophagaceae bacterium]|jgi:ribonuclease P protein component|nr:ribonuclease P protein component [Chitinophagaceae bacterium]MCE2972891.1 ribonuclease P protein component [Sediminibacterium sp.]
MTDRQFTFPTAEKLKSRKLIQQLFAQGKSAHVPLLTCHFLIDPAPLPVPLQAGVGASSRQFKKATDRNRIKRLLREAYRHNKHELQKMLTAHGQTMVLFFIYTGKELPTLQQVENAVQLILQQLQRRISTTKPS